MSGVHPARWKNKAQCRLEGDPRDWDDVLDGETEGAQRLRHARAKAACARCPAREECQQWVNLWTDSGIWFGIHLEKWRKDQGASNEPQYRWSA